MPKIDWIDVSVAIVLGVITNIIYDVIIKGTICSNDDGNAKTTPVAYLLVLGLALFGAYILFKNRKQLSLKNA